MTRSEMRGTVTIIVMIRFNLDDADASIVPPVSHALYRSICPQLLLVRVFGIRLVVGAGCQPWSAIFPAQDWFLVYQPRRVERLSQSWGVTGFEPAFNCLRGHPEATALTTRLLHPLERFSTCKVTCAETCGAEMSSLLRTFQNM